MNKEESLCNSCEYRLHRVIVPDNIEDYEAEFDRAELQIGDNEVIVIEQTICLVLDAELHDHVVIECNKHTPMETVGAAFRNPELLT